MVTTAELDPKLEEDITYDLQRAVRSAVAGHPQGAVRRIVLYAVVTIAFVVAVLAPAPTAVGIAALAVALTALLLLAVTDQLA